jgi:mannan endo-1,4-beta-mannosidase
MARFRRVRVGLVAVVAFTAPSLAVVASPVSAASRPASAAACSTSGITGQTVLSQTAETANLYNNLKDLCGGKGGVMLWGVHDNPNLTSGNTDQEVDALVGQYPGFVEATYTDNTICGSAGGSTLANFTAEIAAQYNRGGVAGVHWLPEDPVTCDPEGDDTGLGANEDICDQIIPGYSTSNTTYEAHFNDELNDLIAALNGLVGTNGQQIPVLLRIFHEMTGSEHWWGGSHCSGPEYQKLWHYAINYLAGHKVPLAPLGLKPVNNAILVWAPGGLPNGSTETPSEFASSITQYYPGAAYVDVAGVDAYDKTSGNFVNEPMSDATAVLDAVKGIVLFAADEGKIPAMTEGENDLQGSIDCQGSPCYWTNYVTQFQSAISKFASIRYAMVWDGTFAPAPGDSGDFTKMFDSSLGSYLIMADNPSYPWYCAHFSC